MLRENTKIKDAAVAMQQAFASGDEKTIQDAFEEYGKAISFQIFADHESSRGNKEILLQRGYHIPTSEEDSYYNAVIEAGKQKTVQAMNGLLSDKVMPVTIIEDVYKELIAEHPLLSRINFVSVAYLTRWILNDHTVDTAVWGDVTDEIAKEITSAFKTIEITQCKLSAYAVIEKDILDLGPMFIDAYIRTFLKEALLIALEKAIISGNGVKCPIGLNRDIHEGVSYSTSTGYPEKEAIKVNSFTPKEYGELLSRLAVSEKGNMRRFDQVTLICNQVDFLGKIMPATTVLNTTTGLYTKDLFPFPTEIIRSNEVDTGKVIITLPEEYFMGIGTGKEGTLEYSDDFRFLEDQRVFKIKMHGMGRAYDNTVSVVVDISDLEPASLLVTELVPTA